MTPPQATSAADPIQTARNALREGNVSLRTLASTPGAERLRAREVLSR